MLNFKNSTWSRKIEWCYRNHWRPSVIWYLYISHAFGYFSLPRAHLNLSKHLAVVQNGFVKNCCCFSYFYNKAMENPLSLDQCYNKNCVLVWEKKNHSEIIQFNHWKSLRLGCICLYYIFMSSFRHFQEPIKGITWSPFVSFNATYSY